MRSARLSPDPLVLPVMVLWFEQTLLPASLRQEFGFEPATAFVDRPVTTSGELVADLTVPGHIYLLATRVVLADALAPPLLDFDFPDVHEAWYSRVQSDGVLCLAAGPRPPTEYPDMTALLTDCQLLQVNLAVRANASGTFTG